MSDRLNAWVAHTTLALICVVAISDSVKPSDRESKDKYVLATAIMSLIVGSIMFVAHFVEKMRKVFLGNMLELLMSTFLLSFWVVAIIILQNPKNELSTVVAGGGIEVISYANLYFFGWLCFFSSVYLVASVFRDKNSFDPKLLTWFLLFFTSIVLFGTAVNLHDDICDVNPGRTCIRTNFAIAISVIVSLLSLIGILCLTCMVRVKPLFDLALGGISALFYFFGVTILTSASGPARSICTMYFASWAGAAFSFSIFFAAFREVFMSASDQYNSGNGASGGGIPTNNTRDVEDGVIVPSPTATRTVDLSQTSPAIATGDKDEGDDADDSRTLPTTDHIVEMNMKQIPDDQA